MVFRVCEGEIVAGAELFSSLGVAAENQPEIIAESGAQPGLDRRKNHVIVVKRHEGWCVWPGNGLKCLRMGS